MNLRKADLLSVFGSSYRVHISQNENTHFLSIWKTNRMFKSILFLSLYIIAGVFSWGAYSFLSEEDASIESLAKMANELAPEVNLTSKKETTNIVSRWKDYDGNWNYEKAPFSELTFNNYDEELKNLPDRSQE